ncbi:glycosyltransferase family protein [Pontibacter pudoricolor]|uniref:glycosyltransferase family 4 protein n=1 Tax=Pontibacter pudoricolor TaxID=2694930 RepID=UPI001391DF02|nr:glycosyltransferase family 4 protein [Pontibacter pudoricolor]
MTVLLFDLKQWTIGLEEEYTKQFPQVSFVYLPITKSHFYSWLTSSLLNSFAKKADKIFRSSLFIAALASDKRSYVLHQKLRQLNLNSVDLVIAHNLGALYPAYQFAKQYQIPFGFDVEDFHPGEVIKVDAVKEIIRRTVLMKQLLLKANYVTAASPLIAEEVKRLCNVPVITVNNSFYSSEFRSASSKLSNEKVNLVWFSQNINFGRGLELLLPALDIFSYKVNLTLIGNLNPEFAETYLTGRNYVVIKAPLSQKDLHQMLSDYDIGLALEISTTDLNKDIALSNKIFAYKQAGLYILATDTKAQLAFMASYKDDGIVTEQNVQALVTIIEFILGNIESIRASKQKRFDQARGIAFETEAQKLVTLWERALQK